MNETRFTAPGGAQQAGSQPAAESLSTVDGRHVLRMRRRLAHPQELVWRAITDPAHLRHWFPAEVQLAATVGAPVRFSFGGDGTVTAADPPHLLEYSWGGTILRWELTPDDGGCVLVFVHTFDDRPGAASFAAGWNACIAALDARLAGREPPSPSRMVREHEEFVRRFGLDEGSVTTTPEGWRVRFERQLTVPAAQAWAAATGDRDPVVDRPVPAGFAPAGGTVRVVDAPKLLEFDSADGQVRWELTDGTGHGARLIVTHDGRDGAPGPRQDAWRAHIEAFAAPSA